MTWTTGKHRNKGQGRVGWGEAKQIASSAHADTSRWVRGNAGNLVFPSKDQDPLKPKFLFYQGHLRYEAVESSKYISLFSSAKLREPSLREQGHWVSEVLGECPDHGRAKDARASEPLRNGKVLPLTPLLVGVGWGWSLLGNSRASPSGLCWGIDSVCRKCLLWFSALEYLWPGDSSSTETAPTETS